MRQRIKTGLLVWVCFLLFFIRGTAQTPVILDNDEPGFSTTGTWTLRTWGTHYGGSARVKGQGDGSASATWETDLTFPGQYRIDMYVEPGAYAEQAPVTILTQSGDSIVYMDQFWYTDGWQTLGTFNLPTSTRIQLTDNYTGGGSFIVADAVRWTLETETYNISGELAFSDNNEISTAKIGLFSVWNDDPLLQQIISPENRVFSFSELMEGWYRLQITAWGYDTLTVDSIQVAGNDVTGLSPVLNPSAGLRYDISGSVSFNDESDSSVCRVEIFPVNYPLSAGYDSVTHNESYLFADLPEGDYKLIFLTTGYQTDSTTYAPVQLTGSDLQLDPLTLFRVFKFAWISDSHVGAGFTEAGLQEVISNINSMSDELDFLINTGDLTEKGLNSELALYKSIVDNCQIPVYSIPGNHDTKWSESGMEKLRQILGGLHFSFRHKGFRFIGLNSGIPLRGGGGYFDPLDIQWLHDELTGMESPDTPVIITWHHPGDFGSIYNYWEVLDILKEYRTALILVGHGHSNRSYDYEGLSALMTLDTYSATSGFNIITATERDISVATCYSGSGLANPWFQKTVESAPQISISFQNLAENEILSGSRIIQVTTGEPVSQGTWTLRYGSPGSGALSGSGSSWQFALDTETLTNGYNTVTVSFSTNTGNTITKTRGFRSENSFPKGIWRYNAGATVLTSPASDSDRVYFGTSDGRIIGLDRSDGSEIWPPVSTGGTVFSSPCVDNGYVYTGSSDGNLYVIDGSTGVIAWTFYAGNAILTPPLVVDSLVYFGSGNRFYAVNINTHEDLWYCSVSGMVESRPVVSGNRIFFTAWDRSLHARNRFNGEVEWQWSRVSSFYYSPGACWPVVGSNRVFVTDPQRYMSAIRQDNGTTIWSDNTPESWESIGISEDKTRIYMRSLDGNLYAYSATAPSRHQLWSAALDYGWDSTPSMPVEKSGAVFSGSKKGFVSAVDAITGQPLWKYWVSQAYVSTVTPVDGIRVLASAISGTVTLIEGDPALDIHDPHYVSLPVENRINRVYPNPSNSEITVEYSLAETQGITLRIFNIVGQKIREIDIPSQPAGYHRYRWSGINDEGSSVPTGIYFISVGNSDFSDFTKVIILK